MNNFFNNQITGDPQGLSFIIRKMKDTMPADQFIREVNKNSEEAIQRVQKENLDYHGIIKFKMDEEYYKKNKVSKLCIIDTGDGMDYNFLDSYMLKLGASTRGNKYQNWGAGFKISALPFNDYGIVISSWTKKSNYGYMIWVQYNEKKSVYELKLIGNKKVTRLDPSVKPAEIKEHGTKITFLGDKKSHDTMEVHDLLKKGGLFRGGRTGKTNWIPSYLNTKKYKMEKNIKTVCLVDTSRIIKGHYVGLKDCCLQHGTVQLSKAEVDWFIVPARKDRANNVTLTSGQFAVVHEDETLKVDYSGKSDRNPLAAWGHQYSKFRVVLVLKPDVGEFRPNLERTDIYKEGVKIEEYFDNWKEEWQTKTPEPLILLEKEMAKKAMEKTSSYEQELKKLADLFRSNQYMLLANGEFDIAKDRAFKTGGNKNIQGKDTPESTSDSGPNPDKEYGEIEQELGIKIDRSENKGVLTRNNPYPKVGFQSHGSESPIAMFERSTYSVVVNEDSLQIEQLVGHRAKKDKLNNHAVVKDALLQIISFQIKQQVAHVYHLTQWDEETIERALSPESLTACLANKGMLLDKLDERLKDMKIVVKNLWNKDEISSPLSENLDRFPSHEKI